MRTWTHIIIDGINGLLSSFSKSDKDNSAVEELKETAEKAGIKIPKDLMPEGKNAPLSSQSQVPSPQEKDSSTSLSQKTNNSKQPENINLEGIKGRNLGNLKNPHVYKAMTNNISDMKFAQYEKMGLLNLCAKQREERLRKK